MILSPNSFVVTNKMEEGGRQLFPRPTLSLLDLEKMLCVLEFQRELNMLLKASGKCNDFGNFRKSPASNPNNLSHTPRLARRHQMV